MKHSDELQGLYPGRDTQISFSFVAQPPNSPDLNILDLGAWNSLQVAVEKLRGERTLHELQVEELREACKQAWDEWDGEEKLSKLFDMLKKIIDIVHDIGGDNVYEMPTENTQKSTICSPTFQVTFFLKHSGK